MQKQHIFLYPFYYIDYALAQIGAFQFYGRMKEDRAAAWSDYCQLCRRGGSLGYFQTLASAGLDNPFQPGYRGEGCPGRVPGSGPLIGRKALRIKEKRDGFCHPA